MTTITINYQLSDSQQEKYNKWLKTLTGAHKHIPTNWCVQYNKIGVIIKARKGKKSIDLTECEIW
jgi:hypothetical protein